MAFKRKEDELRHQERTHAFKDVLSLNINWVGTKGKL